MHTWTRNYTGQVYYAPISHASPRTPFPDDSILGDTYGHLISQPCPYPYSLRLGPILVT